MPQVNFTWVPGEAGWVALITLITEIIKANEKMWEAASDDQKKAMIQWHIDNVNWWRTFLGKIPGLSQQPTE